MCSMIFSLSISCAFAGSDFFAFKIWEAAMRLRNDRQLGGLEMTGWLGYV